MSRRSRRRDEDDVDEISVICDKCSWNLYRYKDTKRNRKIMRTKVERHKSHKGQDHTVTVNEHI